MVNVNWNADDRKWNVNTWQRDDNRWNAGNRVFSLETIKFLPGTEAREFSFQDPSSNHQASCRSLAGARRVVSIYRLLHIYSPKLSARRILLHRVWKWLSLSDEFWFQVVNKWR